jgi:hypothetical protein
MLFLCFFTASTNSSKGKVTCANLTSVGPMHMQSQRAGHCRWLHIGFDSVTAKPRDLVNCTECRCVI